MNGTPRQTVITFPNGEYDEITQGLHSGTASLERSLCDDSEQVTIEGCIASEFKATIEGIDNLSGLKIKVLQRIYGYEMPLFTGWVCDCPLQQDRKSRSLTAYDDLYRCADINVADWYNSITYPVDIGVFLKSLLDYVGIPYTGALEIRQFFSVRKTLDTNSLPFSMVIKAICQIIGGFGIIKPNGEFSIVYMSNKGSVYELEAMSGFELEQYSVKAIDKVVVRSEETDVGGQYGEGNNAYIIQGNFLCFGMTADEIGAVATKLYMNVAGFSWRPCCFGPAISNPLIGCDGLRYHVTTSQGDSFETYIFNSYISGVQLFNQELESYGSEYRKETVVNAHTENLVTAYKVMKVKSTVDGFERSIEETNSNVDELTKKHSALEQDVGKFKTTVSETYETKTNVNAVNNALTQKYSTLEQNLNGFKTEVAKEYTPLEIFNTLNIGGTNLLPDTNTNTLNPVSGSVTRYWSDTAVSENISCEFIELTDPPVKGLKYGVRHRCTAITNSGRNLTWRASEKIEMEDGEDYTLSVYARVVSGDSATLRFRFYAIGYHTTNIVITNTEWKRVSVTIKVDKTKFTDDGYCNIGCGGLVGTTISTVELCGFKLEKGNKATDWTPAPQDTDSSITTLSAKYSTLEQDVSGFKATVSETYTTLDKFNSMEIGGRNILRGSYIKSLSNANSWEAGGFKATSGGNGVVSVVPVDDSPVKSIDYAVQITGNTSGNRDIAQTGIPYIPGVEYTFSVWVKGTGTLLFRSWNSTTGAQDASICKRAVSFDKWTRVTDTFISGSAEGSKTIQFGVTGSCDSIMFVAPKLEKGNKATDWTLAPEDTDTVITSIQTIATQTANKFNWLVKSGTSQTDFTLTDRMAELTAKIISLNGDVKVNGDMIVNGAVTSDKIAIGDFTNLSVLNPDTYIPNNPDNYEEYMVVTDADGSKWFEFGSDTTLKYYHIFLNNLPGSTTFKRGDKYLFRALMRASMETSVRICLRAFYSDGGSPAYTNMASVYNDAIPTEQTYIQIPFTINALPTPGRPIQRYGLFLETRNTKLGTIYAREFAVHQMINNVLIADGEITADKVDVTDLFAQDITASGSITTPLLKSSDYSYTSGDYSKAGMLVDLRNKIIRTPKFSLKADGSICATDGIFSGNMTANSGSIAGSLTFGANGSIVHTNGNYTITLRAVPNNAALGVLYIGDRSSGSATYPFRLNGDGSFVATKATITGNITADEGKIGPVTIQKNQGLYYNPTTSTGFGLWATKEHANIAFHAGANNNNIGGAPFRVYHDGSVVAKNLTSDNINITGGSIGNWSVGTSGELLGKGSDKVLQLYPDGRDYQASDGKTYKFYIIIRNTINDKPVGGITESGWKSIS